MKKVKLFEQFISEGSWAMNKSKIKPFIKDLEKANNAKDIIKIQNKYWDHIGEDDLMDYLDRAIKAKDISSDDFQDGVADAIGRLRDFMNESFITEKQLKGLNGISDDQHLKDISDAQKLKIIQGTGNNISFKVPEGFNRNFWQVFSKGKIKSKKNLAGDKVFYLPGKIIDSPNFKSEKDLIDGVDWESVQQTREFNA